MSVFKIGDKVENIFAAEDGEEDRFRYGVVNDVYFDREGTEQVEVMYPGYYYADSLGEYLRPDPRQ